MVRLFVRHDVADFDTWRKGYDDAEDIRQKHGVRHAEIYVSVDDGRDVTVFHDSDSEDQAKAFSSDPDLKAAMDQIGVVGAPTIWVTKQS